MEVLTPKRLELSSGSLTGETSMKLNAFHCMILAIVLVIMIRGIRTDVSAIWAGHGRCWRLEMELR